MKVRGTSLWLVVGVIVATWEGLIATPVGAWTSYSVPWGLLEAVDQNPSPPCAGNSTVFVDALDGYTEANLNVYQHGTGDHLYNVTHYAKAFAQCHGFVVINRELDDYSYTRAEIWVNGQRSYQLSDTDFSGTHKIYCEGKATLTLNNYEQESPPPKSETWRYDTAGSQLNVGFSIGWSRNNWPKVYDLSIVKVSYRSEASAETCVRLDPYVAFPCENISAYQRVTGSLPNLDFRD